MIEAQSLTRRYGAVTAVNRVSFRIGDNGVVGLLGHNGAGKTTIMKMLSGYLEPTAGSLRVADHDYADGCRAVQRFLGYLPENLPLYPDMLVADYLDYVATCKGIHRRQRPRAIREAMLATDIAGRMLDPVRTLSRGLRQRVGVAQAVLGSPRLLILDEPTNGLDPEQTGHMRELVRRLARRATVLLSTHIMQEVDAVCDRVLILHRGRLALDASLAELRHSDTLALRVRAASEPLRHALEQQDTIASVEALPHCNEYRLLLRSGEDPDGAATGIARVVLEQGADLCELQPLQRDLETVFREATGGAAT